MIIKILHKNNEIKLRIFSFLFFCVTNSDDDFTGSKILWSLMISNKRYQKVNWVERNLGVMVRYVQLTQGSVKFFECHTCTCDKVKKQDVLHENARDCWCSEFISKCVSPILIMNESVINTKIEKFQKDQKDNEESTSGWIRFVIDLFSFDRYDLDSV